MAEFVVSIGSNGRIASQGSLSSALAKDKKLFAEVEKENEAIEKAEHDPLESETTPDADTKAAAQAGKPGRMYRIEGDVSKKVRFKSKHEYQIVCQTLRV